jgi:rhomboid family protein
VVIPVYDENGIPRPGFWPWVTWLLVAINVVVVLFLAVLPDEAVVAIGFNFGVVPGFITGYFNTSELGLLIPPLLTLVSYMFIHQSWVHLAANMIFLWVFGDDIEAAVGHVRYLMFYLLCGMAGGATHLAVAPRSLIPLVGASGAVAGVIGAYLMLRPFARIIVLLFGIITVRIHAYWLLTAWIVWQFVNAIFILSDTEVAYWSHLGGFFAGVALVFAFRRAGVKLFQVH